jgi:hypothetical protein
MTELPLPEIWNKMTVGEKRLWVLERTAELLKRKFSFPSDASSITELPMPKIWNKMTVGEKRLWILERGREVSLQENLTFSMDNLHPPL